MASLRRRSRHPLVQEARRWPPPSPRLIWPVRLSVVVTWRRDPTSVVLAVFPSTGATWPVPPFPPRGLVGSIPPLRRYYETLRLLAVHPPALRCLRPAVPSEHLRLRSERTPGAASTASGLVSRVPAAPAVFKMETTRASPGFPGNPFPHASASRAPTIGEVACFPRPLRRGEMTFRPTHDVGPRTQCISGLNHAAYGLPVNASRSLGHPRPTHHSVPAGGRPWPDGIGYPQGVEQGFEDHITASCPPVTGLSRHSRRWCTTLRLRRGSCRLSGHGDRCGCTIST